MADFSTLALSLARRIETDPADPGLEGELESMRELWRSLEAVERSEAADAARALAEARARLATSPPPADDQAAAQLALSGLDRIDVDAPPERRYDGGRDPDAL